MHRCLRRRRTAAGRPGSRRAANCGFRRNPLVCISYHPERTRKWSGVFFGQRLSTGFVRSPKKTPDPVGWLRWLAPNIAPTETRSARAQAREVPSRLSLTLRACVTCEKCGLGYSDNTAVPAVSQVDSPICFLTGARKIGVLLLR
jgi:hypothetical protein